MKTATTTNKILTSLMASACALLTACGGSPLDTNGKQTASAAQTAATSTVKAPAQPMHTTYVVERTSYTLSSSREFKGFNAELWNNRKWYECNCSNKQESLPSKMPW